MKKLFIILIVTPLLLSITLKAEVDSDTEGRLDNLIAQYISELNPNLSTQVIAKKSNKIPESCLFPDIKISNKNKTYGNINLIITCDNTKSYLPVYVQAIGQYVASTKALARGSILTADDLIIMTGRIDNLPKLADDNIENLVGAEALKNIEENSPLLSNSIKKPWIIKSGQAVLITYNGSGFTAKNSGKAINNASLGDVVRVRVGANEIVDAKAVGTGMAEINL